MPFRPACLLSRLVQRGRRSGKHNHRTVGPNWQIVRQTGAPLFITNMSPVNVSGRGAYDLSIGADRQMDISEWMPSIDYTCPFSCLLLNQEG